MWGEGLVPNQGGKQDKRGAAAGAPSSTGQDYQGLLASSGKAPGGGSLDV